jgi:hypothetical protein
MKPEISLVPACCLQLSESNPDQNALKNDLGAPQISALFLAIFGSRASHPVDTNYQHMDSIGFELALRPNACGRCTHLPPDANPTALCKLIPIVPKTRPKTASQSVRSHVTLSPGYGTL